MSDFSPQIAPKRTHPPQNFPQRRTITQHETTSPLTKPIGHAATVEYLRWRNPERVAAGPAINAEGLTEWSRICSEQKALVAKVAERAGKRAPVDICLWVIGNPK
jgi:hypothetical protein